MLLLKSHSVSRLAALCSAVLVLTVSTIVGAQEVASEEWTPRELDTWMKMVDTNEVFVETGSTDHLTEIAAKLLADGSIVGVFRGRAEVGKRALGNRSILASPAQRSTLTRVNMVKGRQPWRPGAGNLFWGRR